MRHFSFTPEILGVFPKALPIFVFFHFTSPFNALIPFSLFPLANVDFATGRPSARGEIAIGLRCGCCICKWQHCDSSLSLRRPRHPTRKAIRDKERIDRDNTPSQSKHAQEMLSAQTVWNQLSPEARERDSEMVLGEEKSGKRERVKYWVMWPAYKRRLLVCDFYEFTFLWASYVGLWLLSVGLTEDRMKLVWKSDIYKGHIMKKSNFAWSFEIKKKKSSLY